MARHSSPRHRSRSWTWSTGSSAIHRLPAETAGRRSRDGSFAEQLLPPLAAFGSPVVARATAGDRTTAHAVAGSAGIRQPEDAELAQLVGRQGIRRARIAPGHVPRVLEEHGAHVLALDLLREHRAVELSELLLDVRRQLRAGGQAHRSIVRRLD